MKKLPFKHFHAVESRDTKYTSFFHSVVTLALLTLFATRGQINMETRKLNMSLLKNQVFQLESLVTVSSSGREKRVWHDSWYEVSCTCRYETAVTNGDYSDYQRIRTTNGGNVTAFLNFNLQSFCDADLENFPLDVHRCCFHLQPKVYPGITVFNAKDVAARIDRQYFRNTGWNFGQIQTKDGWDDEGVADLQWCMDLTRSSTTLRVELSVPMGICAVLILITPLFGAIQIQIYVKLFALLLQYLCLQYLANKTSQIGMASTTPRICKFGNTQTHKSQHAKCYTRR